MNEGRTLLLERARRLYEEAWSKPHGVLLLDDIMAEDHQQIDQVWQGNTAGIGRKRMKRGILAYRSAYPDIQFVVQSAAAVPGKNEVFVYWTASGTNTGNIRDQPPSGQHVQFSGVTLVRFNAAGQIQQSIVFREAPSDEARYFTAKQS